MSSSSTPPPPPSTTIGEHLSRGHRELENLAELAREALTRGDRGECQRRWDLLREALTSHMVVEESHLLPRLLASAGRLARTLVAEHNHLRTRLAELGQAVAAWTANHHELGRFLDELRAHAMHEAAAIYPWADEHLDPAEVAAILAE